MSLLLKALENAARNREATGAAADASSAPADSKEPAEELTLEPMPQSARAQGAARSQPQPPRGSAQGAAVDEERSTSQHQAQSVLRAGAPVSRPGIFEWFARRPIVAFSTAAGLFAIGYGTYLYLQLTNPGIFVSRPAPVAKPPVVATNPPPAQAPAPPPPAIAPVPPVPNPAATAPAPATPTSVLPSPAFTPGPVPAAPPAAAPAPPAPAASAPPSAAASTPVPAPAPPAQEPAAAAKAPAPAQPAPAGPRIAITPTQPEAPVAARPRAARPAPARTAATQPPAEGIAPSAASPVVVPVSATLSSAYQALERGQADEAERLYRQSLASDPRSVDAMLGLAATLTTQGKSEAATQYYMRVLEQDPRNAYAQAGLLNLRGGADPVSAEARLRQLIAREPSGFLYFSLGNLYAEYGQWAQAQAAYFQAHTLAPDNPDYAFNLAVGLEHLSQPKIALNYYRRALALAQSRGYAQFDAAGVQSRIRSLETVLAEKP